MKSSFFSLGFIWIGIDSWFEIHYNYILLSVEGVGCYHYRT
jgi:hypothetical protein